MLSELSSLDLHPEDKIRLELKEYKAQLIEHLKSKPKDNNSRWERKKALNVLGKQAAEKVEKITEPTDDDKRDWAFFLYSLAQGVEQAVLLSYKKAAELISTIDKDKLTDDDKRWWALYLYKLADLNTKNESFPKAQKYYEKALDVISKIATPNDEDKRRTIRCLTELKRYGHQTR